MKRFLLCATLIFISTISFGQNPPAPMPDTVPVAPPMTAVNPDNSITFRLTYPGARQVTVATDALLQPLTMTQDANGLWTATTPPLPPEHYGYTFIVDGVHMLDPLNFDVHPNYMDFYSDILVQANPPAPWELTDIPHGYVTRHIFTTRIAQHFPDNQTAYVVYTPPGYNAKRKGGYPVLYLLHGFSDTEEGWTRAGKANLMLDRLLADGKIVPMIVVMPRGYGDFDVVSHGRFAPRDRTANQQNVPLFVQMLINEIIPDVEHTYNVAKGRDNRAIAGLSMGGEESITASLTHPELFAWVGGMSAALPRSEFDTRFPNVDAKKDKFRLIWTACGTDDRLITPNRNFAAWAKQKGLPMTAVEMPGAHTFIVWRNSLLMLAPLLFRK